MAFTWSAISQSLQLNPLNPRCLGVQTSFDTLVWQILKRSLSPNIYVPRHKGQGGSGFLTPILAPDREASQQDLQTHPCRSPRLVVTIFIRDGYMACVSRNHYLCVPELSTLQPKFSFRLDKQHLGLRLPTASKRLKPITGATSQWYWNRTLTFFIWISWCYIFVELHKSEWMYMCVSVSNFAFKLIKSKKHFKHAPNILHRRWDLTWVK